MQTLGGMAHMDFNRPSANTCEEAFDVLHRLELGREAVSQWPKPAREQDVPREMIERIQVGLRLRIS